MDAFDHHLNVFMIESAIGWLLTVLAAPHIGLTSVFMVSLVSATLTPAGLVVSGSINTQLGKTLRIRRAGRSRNRVVYGIRRGKVTEAGHDAKGHRLYRWDELLTLAARAS